VGSKRRKFECSSPGSKEEAEDNAYLRETTGRTGNEKIASRSKENSRGTKDHIGLVGAPAIARRKSHNIVGNREIKNGKGAQAVSGSR
jgi:hypothetical protein